MAEAADQHKVDRSTVVHALRTAKQGALDALAASVPGRAGVSREQAALEAAQVEISRLRTTVTEQAVALHLHEGKARWDVCPERNVVAMWLSALERGGVLI